MTRKTTWAWPLACAIALAACGSSSPDRAAVVGDMTGTAVPARYSQLAGEAAVLTEQVGEWCETGDGTAVREQSATVQGEWVGLAPFWFGPVMDRRSRFIIDPSARADDVDELLASDATIDPAALRERFGADQRGLQALDVVLDADERTDRHCTYALAIAALISEETQLLADDWATFGPEQSTDDTAANDALEQIVNESLFGIDAMARQSVAGDPDKLDGVRWAIIGDGTAAMSGLSGLLNDDVVEQLEAEFDAAKSLEPDALFELDRTITTNIVSALGLSVQFSDADGDG